MSDLLENNAYSETTDLTPTKIATKKRKRLLIAIVIICIIIPPYALLTFLGFIAYPKWYLLGSFYLHKSSFEYIKDSGVNFSYNFFEERDFDKYDDKKLAKSIKTVVRCHFSEAWWDKQETWDKSLDRNILIFETDNTAGLSNTRGILYCDEEIEWYDDFYYDCKCKPLGGGWYYYYAARKGEYYRDKLG